MAMVMMMMMMMMKMHISTDNHEISLATHALLISDFLIYPKDLFAINHSHQLQDINDKCKPFRGD